MTGSTISSEGLDARRRKLLFRSWHRGTREADLIMGRFADAHIASLSDAELDLDLLVYGDERRATIDFMLPHPRATERRFVMAPAAEKVGTRGQLSHAEYLERLEKASVVNTLDNLMTFPRLRKLIERGAVTLHGAYFGVAMLVAASLVPHERRAPNRQR